MLTQNQIKEASAAAAAHFGKGFHCAEAVAWTVLEALGDDPRQAAAHATAFGGGFGRSFEEACGALSGGLIVIGHLHGRRKPEGEWDLAANMGAELRQCFKSDFGTTHCGSLRESFGQEHQMEQCRILVERLVIMLLELLSEDKGECDGLTCYRQAVAGASH